MRYGITPANCSAHYRLAPRPAKVAHPVLVRGKRQYGDKAERGKRLKVDKAHPAYVAAAKQVDFLNAYMARQSITGCEFHGFHRIFAHGDQPGFAYDLGGRLYAIGGSYQNMPKADRASIRLNGEAVVELDVRASFLTILYGLAGLALDPVSDPYLIGDLPRDVVKAWIGMTMGYDGFQKKWSKASVDRLYEKKGIDLRDYDIAGIRSVVLARHPILGNWKDSTFRWPHLQYIESQIVLATLQELARVHDVPALPIHDSILIPVSRLATAEKAFSTCFEQSVGLRPYLSCK